MILRVWHGWASGARADAYEKLLNTSIAPAILRRGIPGLLDLSVLRREPATPSDVDTEFLTLMTFDDWPAIHTFTGGDPHASVVPPEAQALLTRYDPHPQHYTLLHRHH